MRDPLVDLKTKAGTWSRAIRRYEEWSRIIDIPSRRSPSRARLIIEEHRCTNPHCGKDFTSKRYASSQRRIRCPHCLRGRSVLISKRTEYEFVPAVGAPNPKRHERYTRLDWLMDFVAWCENNLPARRFGKQRKVTHLRVKDLLDWVLVEGLTYRDAGERHLELYGIEIPKSTMYDLFGYWRRCYDGKRRRPCSST